MTKGRLLRERYVWVGAVAVLATSLVWLATIDIVLLLRASSAGAPAAWVLARALARAALLVIQRCWPLVPATLAAAVLIYGLARPPRSERLEERSVGRV